MDEYIKREYAVDAVLDVYYDTPDIDLSGEKFEAAILKIQAANVAPVRHGEWVVRGDGDNVPWMCSRCGKTTAHKYKVMYGKYCPNCGCKMDLKEEQHELRRDL